MQGSRIRPFYGTGGGKKFYTKRRIGWTYNGGEWPGDRAPSYPYFCHNTRGRRIVTPGRQALPSRGNQSLKEFLRWSVRSTEEGSQEVGQ